MPNSQRNGLVLFALLTVLLGGAFAALPGHSQTPATSIKGKLLNNEPTAASTASVAAPQADKDSPAAGAAVSDAVLAAAVQQNISLKNDLNWAFGGKQQRGWSLYVPLIRHLIGTDKDAGTSDFALALSRWQKSNGLASHGVLDSDTLSLMVSTWQARRTKDRTYPQPYQVLTVPASEFYDPTRPEELRQVEQQTYAAYKRMIAAAAADPTLQLALTRDGDLAPSEKFLKIISAFRSREYQEQLRKQSPTVGRAGLAINSPHFTGRALDLYVGGEPVSTKDANRAIQVQTRVYQWLVKNAEKFGFYPYYYEPWHWEYRPQ